MTVVDVPDLTGPQFPPEDFDRINCFGRAEIAPAAGKEVSFTVPNGVVWRVVSMTAKLTTSSTIANRYVGFQVKQQDGTAVYQFQSTSALAASDSLTVTFSEDISTLTTVATTDVLLLPKPSVWFPPGWSFGTLTGNIQTGDAYSDVALWVHEWLPC